VKTAKRLILLAIVIVAGAWLWTVLFPGPEKIVRKRLAQAASGASFKSGENLLFTAARAETFADLFSTNVEVNIDLPEHGRHSLVGREEIMQAAAGARSEVKSLKVEFPDMNITVSPDKLSAVADVTLQVRAAGEKELFVQEVKFTFQKIGGDWLITRVETVRTLS
jgi:hypothetical protein